MEQQLMRPFVLEYAGHDADGHVIDAATAGASIAGVANLYNSVLHFYFVGKIPKRDSEMMIRTYARPPSAASWDIVFYAATIYNQIVAYPEIITKAAEFIFPKIIETIFHGRTGRHKEMMVALNIISEQSANYHDLAKTAFGALAADKDKLFGMMDRLIDKNEKNLTSAVAPVGSSCKTITQFAHTDRAQIIDEAAAEEIRSGRPESIGDQAEFVGVILGVDKSTGGCRVRLKDNGEEIRGNITDPSLKTTHNVYTKALDGADSIILVAKPIIRDGRITKLFISDAREQ